MEALGTATIAVTAVVMIGLALGGMAQALIRSSGNENRRNGDQPGIHNHRPEPRDCN